jgi:hypothetical protein
MSQVCDQWDGSTIKNHFTIILIASDSKGIQWLLLQKHTETVHSRCLLTSPSDYCLQSYLHACLQHPLFIPNAQQKAMFFADCSQNSPFSESHALRSSASYSLSPDIISQTTLFKYLQVATVEHRTVLRRYFCLVVLEPNVERDNDFINRHGMMLVRLEQRKENEKNEKIYIYCTFLRQ